MARRNRRVILVLSDALIMCRNKILHTFQAFGVGIVVLATAQLLSSAFQVFNMNYKHQETVCSTEHPGLAWDVVDQFREQVDDTYVEVLGGGGEGCADSSLVVLMEFTGSPWGHAKRYRKLRNLASERGLSTRGVSFSYEAQGGAGVGLSGALGAVFALLFIIWQRNSRKFVSSSSESCSALVNMLIGLLGGFLSFALVTTLFTAFGELNQLPSWIVLDYSEWVLEPSHFIFIVVWVPIIEEIVFRAWLLEVWRTYMPPWIALLFTAIAFSFLHPMGLVLNCLFVIPGLIFGLIWLKTRSLSACVVAHSVHNGLTLSLA